MGFWRTAAHLLLDTRTAQQADQQQAEHDAMNPPGPGFIQRWRDDRAAEQIADQLAEDNRLIRNSEIPLWQRGDLGHPLGCDCRWCAR
jgi:hypothetical protein